MPIEQEAKFAVKSLREVRAKLEKLGSLHAKCRLERNLLFDTSSHDLEKRGELLRLRETDAVLLTWKRPAPHSGVAAGIKVMEEVETLVGDFDVMRRIILGLGFVEALWYEKFREVWKLDESVICLDILPFGEFVEIEGASQGIARAAACLGLDMAQADSRSYHDLHQRHLAGLGLPPAAGFVFSEQDEFVRQLRRFAG